MNHSLADKYTAQVLSTMKRNHLHLYSHITQVAASHFFMVISVPAY
jgi:hypothetical protein